MYWHVAEYCALHAQSLVELARNNTLCACSYQLNPLYVLITVIAYMMKDRMKEWGKRYLEPVCISLGFEFPDRIVKVSLEDVMHQHLILRSMFNTAQALKTYDSRHSGDASHMAQALLFITNHLVLRLVFTHCIRLQDMQMRVVQKTGTQFSLLQACCRVSVYT